MVHALSEAHRVLKPNGLLIDLRPRAGQRHVGIACNGRFHPLGMVRRSTDDLRAANRAVAQVVAAGLFEAKERVVLDCRRLMDTLDEFEAWRPEFVHSPHEIDMLQKIEGALKANRDGEMKIVGVVPLVLRVLRKSFR